MKPILQLYRFTLLVGYFFLLTISSVSGNEIDSLRAVYKQGNDSAKFEALSDIVVYYRNVNIDSAKFYLKELYSLSTENNFYRLGKAQRLDGTIYHMRNLYDSAETLYNRALKTFSTAKILKGVSSCLNDLGLLYQDRGDYKKAGEYLFRHLRLADSIGNKRELSTAYTNIGLLLYRQKQLKEAIRYYEIALELKKEINDKQGEALLYNNIGVAHYYLENYDRVLDNFKHALVIYRELNNLRGQTMLYYNVGEIYFEKRQDYERALYHYKKSYDIQLAIGDISGQSASLNRIGACYSALKNYDKAIYVQQQALQMSREINTPVQISAALKGLSSTYEKSGDYKNALKCYKEYTLIHDSLVSETNIQQVAKLKEEYETDKKDQEISRLNTEKALQDLKLESHLKDIRSRNIMLIAAVVFIAIVIFAGHSLLKLYRQSKNLNNTLTLKNKVIEQKNSQLSVMYDSVKKISEIKELFLSNVANDLKTPLNVISAFSNQLLTSQIDDSQQYYLEQVKHSSDNLLSLLNNLITYTKFNAGILSLEKLPFTIENIVRFLQNSYEQKAAEKNVTFKVECKHGHDKIIISDQIRIIQICTILIDNAIKNSFSGDSVECYFFIIKEDKLQISITFSGYGIDEDVLSTSISDFNTSLQSDLSDVNLEINIAHRLAELFGGTLNIDTHKNEGTTFNINIPIELKKVADHTKQINKSVISTKFYNVLIANENQEKTTTISNILNAHNPNTIFDCADSGEKAELLLKKNRYDIAFIDVLMHTAENQGFPNFIKTKLSSDNAPKLLIGTVSDKNVEKEISAEYSGFDDYIFSPLDPQKLISLYDNHNAGSNATESIETTDNDTILQNVFAGDNKTNIQETLNFINHELSEHLFKLKYAIKEESKQEMKTILTFIKSNLYYIADDKLNKLLEKLDKAIVKNDKIRIESEFENLQIRCNALQLAISNVCIE
ncbi:MAG TPA: tetratricopeptide repeat protein [Salinivirgaceae bacterium]|nr:tetratricopeptide repeat protein [Salinivirgaceae bacterium]